MEWIKVFSEPLQAKERIVQGKPQLLLIGDVRICLVRLEDKFLAVQDNCTHNGQSLSSGTINYLGEVVCPWHGYRFNLTTGRETGERSGDLVTYPVREDENGVYLWI